MSRSISTAIATDSPPIMAAGLHPKTAAEWRVFCGDAVEVLDKLPQDRYAAVVTSPPYFWLRDYGVAGQLGREPKVDLYVCGIADVMDRVKRVLHPQGLLFLNLGDTYYSGKGRPQGRDRKHSGRHNGNCEPWMRAGLACPRKPCSACRGGLPWR